MSHDCNSRKDYSQELLGFNRKRLEKCSIEKRQSYQPKPVAVVKVDPNRTRLDEMLVNHRFVLPTNIEFRTRHWLKLIT